MAEKIEARRTMKRICAWCNKVMQDGTEPATHGYECSKKVLMEMYKRTSISSAIGEVSGTLRNSHVGAVTTQGTY